MIGFPKTVVVAGWTAVFAGWLVGLWIDRAPAQVVVDNRWQCRPYGITAATVLLCSATGWGSADWQPPRWLALSTLPAFFGGATLYYWARLSLGRQWSSEARIAADHRLVTNGAYRVARHPIYLSKVMMALSSGLLLGNWLVAALGGLLTLAGVYQARIEEELLRGRFGDRYEEYVWRTGMLAPRISVIVSQLRARWSDTSVERLAATR